MILNGGVFSQIFIKPPSEIGTNSNSTCLKTFECCPEHLDQYQTLHFHHQQRQLIPEQAYRQNMESDVRKRAHNVNVEDGLALIHDRRYRCSSQRKGLDKSRGMTIRRRSLFRCTSISTYDTRIANCNFCVNPSGFARVELLTLGVDIKLRPQHVWDLER